MSESDYSDFLKYDFYNCIEKSIFKDGMEKKFDLKYIYYYVKANKILLDNISINNKFSPDEITVPMMPLYKQYGLLHTIEKCIFQIEKKVNKHIIMDMNRVNKLYNSLYDEILHYFNVILHMGDDDVINFSVQKKYTYYKNEYSHRNMIVKKKSIIV